MYALTKRLIFGALLIVGGISFSACEKLLERKPPGELLPEEAIQTASDLEELLNSVYDIAGNTYNGNYQNPGELLSDNLARPQQQDDYTSVWLRSTTIFNGSTGNAYAELWRIVLRANTVLENIDAVEGLSPERAVEIEAEARFLRAVATFDAVRLWAQPYGFTPDNSHPGVAIRTNTTPDAAVRSSVGEVYAFVLDDLNFAAANLPESNDIYATSWSAKGFLTRVYMQMQEYATAADLANDVINNGPFSLDTLGGWYKFPEVTPEAVFVIYSAPLGGGAFNDRSGALRGNYNSAGVNPPLRIAEEFFNGIQEGTPRAAFFEEREQDGNILYVTNLFNATPFHIPLVTLTEMHLTRAECLAYLNQDLATAIADVNAIRERARGNSGTNLPSSASADDIRDAARIERRYELFGTGDRVQQLKRRGVEGEEIVIRDAPWDCPGMVLQFPAVERVDGFPLNETGGCN